MSNTNANTEGLQLTRLVGTNTEIRKPTENVSPFVKRIPETLVFKLLVDPRSSRFYIPMDYYRYTVGPHPEKDVRLRPSLRSLQMVKSSPENELYWDCVNKMQALKKADPAGYKNSDDFKALLTKKKTYAPTSKGWFYIVMPGSEKIKPFLFPKSVIDILFGGRQMDTGGSVREIPSLLTKLQSQGYNPYVLDNKCWLRLTKTGTGKGTKYFVEMATKTEKIVHNGTEMTANVPQEYPVHSTLLESKVTLADFEDPIEYEKQFAFTEEETINFIRSHGTVTGVPERFQKRSRDDADVDDGDDGSADQNAAPSFKSIGVDDMKL